MAIPNINNDQYPDSYIHNILESMPVIALIGASQNPARPSHGVMRFMQDRGYRVIPVNPSLAGEEILGEKVYANLKDIPEAIDMVDIFRNSEAASAAVDDAISIGAETVWMQLKIINKKAAQRALDAGLKVVMNRCPLFEIKRLNIN